MLRFFVAFVLLTGIIFGLEQSAFAKDVEFRFEKPDAQSVELMGEFNNWKAQPMTKQSGGTWTITVSLPPGTHGYKFLVNGTDWYFDPKNSNRKTVAGIENSAMEIAADGGTAPGTVGQGVALPGKLTASPTTMQSPAFPGKLTASPTVSSARSTGPTTTLSVTPGEILTLEVPLSEKRRAEAAKDGNSRLGHAKMAIAVPQNFDPQRSWPVLVISNTETYSNIDSMQQFKQAAVDEGWVIIAADAVEADKNKEGSPRWPTIAAAFDYLTATWPVAKDWPIATGGMSGGGKNSAFLAAELAREHHRIVGMLMMGCNKDMATVAYRKSAPPNFLSAAVFLSSGKSDKIATPEQHEYVKNSLKGTGFQKVRLESFDGAHDIYQPHIGEALRWFTAQSAKTVPVRRDSDFDNFFKKKPPGTP
jgi:hypothetical protein